MKQEDYGIDAPGVVRTLLRVGVLLVSAGTVALLVRSGNGEDVSPILRILPRFLPSGMICLVMGSWMIASSRWLKHGVARALLDSRRWRGDETVLDAGCGRGLIAVNAAKRIPGGHVTGIDTWQERDLGGNTPEAIRVNAEAAGGADRLTVDTGDARSLPYADGPFEVVASMTAIHNIPDAAGRSAALAEMWRVTRPGGQILMFDIRNVREYAAQLKAVGALDVRLNGPILLWGPIGWRMSAAKPATS